MSSNQQIPPWLQEQIAKLQQTQQNLQMTVSQKQQLEFENIETEKSLEELKKVSDDDAVFKFAGTILVKSNKQTLLEDLEEKKELIKTRTTVLAKQEDKLKTSLKEQESKIQEMIKNPSAMGAKQPSEGESSQ
ncbi:MAG TPA: prefoldin subunit beta [Candidatus Nitrosopelagicus sp.]|jgi:prefoldin beta subunit|uniref:Prefoldin subunit beta n=1 Tax=marine metagenome TaxID=408172 RepID=A0A381W2P7_9ZZZZ|nr:prefoldin subunit beta [Nitrosopumilales archaeon]MDP7285429.1 prefoldin subunit beta [Candidatus Nitrosopelagicus sp.]HJN20288.1 prefoldin subunit beta [Candidatus Nitrosopelagicus sp.]|tara:strand:+ start:465 stop:863 length:399 start_codon:yes stop_codon:yes gene_type:complete